MNRFYASVIRFRKALMLLFVLAAIVCAYCRPLIRVNYDMNDYLPKDCASTVAMNVMNEEFGGEIPNARVMIKDVSVREALDYQKQLLQIEGVSAVNWMYDRFPPTIPVEVLPQSTVNTYYQNRNALFTVTIEESSINSAVPSIRALIGDENCMTGNAVSMAAATSSTEREVGIISVCSVLLVFLILTLTTTSWIEPLIVMIGLGIAIVLNAGSNLLFGEISFVTNAAGSILQLAVSLDYSVFLIHRFSECRTQEPDASLAMQDALAQSASSILSSGLTTVIGFLALCLMRFLIGPDLGLALAKGVGISLLTVFLFMPGLILSTYRLMEKTAHRPLLPSFQKFGFAVRKITFPMVLVFCILVVPSFLISTHNEYYFGSSHIFAEGTQYGDDTAEIEAVFGKKDTYVLMIPKGDESTERALQDDLTALSEVTSITSLSSFTGPTLPPELFPQALASQLESEHYRRMILNVDAAYEGEQTYALVETIRSTAQNRYPDQWYLAGAGVSTYDLMDTVTADMTKVNLMAIGAVFLVLLLTMRSVILPVILVLTIETAIWVNLSFPWLSGKPLFYIAYLIISSIQLGATVDYAILLTERYKENRRRTDRHTCVSETVSNVTVSVLTSGFCLVFVGFLMGKVSTHGLLSQLGYLMGRGTLCSLFSVLLVLPGLLYLTDRLFIKPSANPSDSQS